MTWGPHEQAACLRFLTAPVGLRASRALGVRARVFWASGLGGSQLYFGLEILESKLQLFPSKALFEAVGATLLKAN